MNLALARTVADAVLYEGYLLYPYRASSSKNQVRWQFGVLGPPGAADAGLGEEPAMSVQCLLRGDLLCAAADDHAPALVVHLRFLQLQRREVYDDRGRPVDTLTADGTTWTSWDEAVEQEVATPLTVADLTAPSDVPVQVPGGADRTDLEDADGVLRGWVVRRRWPLSARLRVMVEPVEGHSRLGVAVENVHRPPAADKDQAIRRSLIGAHLILESRGAEFVSLLEPPPGAAAAAASCTQHRCWPVLTGAPGDTDLVLGSPIILYDYPEVAQESAGALFDATEIDEILTLRVMTMTDEEKAEARATDPRAREIIDRCDQMTPEALQRLHGVLRDPHAAAAPPSPGGDVRNLDPPSFETGDVSWWDPEADAAVRPEVDAVTVDGVPVRKGSLVRVHPSRRADAQDLFFADQVARVSAVLSDVDGGVHVALVLVDDPAADLHDWYGRYWYFAPDEIDPLPPDEAARVGAATAPAPAAQAAGATPEPARGEENQP